MHELSIAESICRSIISRVGTARVNELVVEVGVLSGVNQDSLTFCLGEAARMAGMQLDRFEVTMVPAQAKCECGESYEAAGLLDPCPKCGGFGYTLSGAEDILIRRLTVEENGGENGEKDQVV